METQRKIGESGLRSRLTLAHARSRHAHAQHAHGAGGSERLSSNDADQAGSAGGIKETNGGTCDPRVPRSGSDGAPPRGHKEDSGAPRSPRDRQFLSLVSLAFERQSSQRGVVLEAFRSGKCRSIRYGASLGGGLSAVRLGCGGLSAVRTLFAGPPYSPITIRLLDHLPSCPLNAQPLLWRHGGRVRARARAWADAPRRLQVRSESRLGAAPCIRLIGWRRGGQESRRSAIRNCTSARRPQLRNRP